MFSTLFMQLLLLFALLLIVVVVLWMCILIFFCCFLPFDNKSEVIPFPFPFIQVTSLFLMSLNKK